MSCRTYIYYQNAELANAGNASAPTIADTFSAISADYPGHAPSSYQVNQGDTFQSIAQSVWGDSRMWYLIADANGKDASSPLVAGTSLRIPNVVGSTHNDSTTFKPYSAEEVIGNTITAPQPPKPKKKKCNGAASVVMVVVAVVATIFTAGAAGALIAGTATSLSGAAVAGVAAFSGTIAATGMGLVAAVGIGGVAGSIASQAVGKAMGVVDNISWKQAAVAGLGSAIGAGIVNLATQASGTLSSAMKAVQDSQASWSQVALSYGAQGVAGYAGSYIASKAVGLDTSFSWKNMAASAIGSIVAGSINQNSGFLNSTIRGQISAHSTAWMRDKWFGGERPDYGQVAADAFGNTLVDLAVDQLRERPAKKSSEYRYLDDQGRELVAEVLSKDAFYEKYGYAVASTGGGGQSDPRFDAEIEALVEARLSGWFGLSSSLGGDESFAYAPTSRSPDSPKSIGSISEDSGYITNMGNILTSDISLGDKLSMAWGMTGYAYRGSDAAQGTVQILGGGLEVAGAAGLTTTSFGIGLAVPLALHGGDSIAAGFNRAFNGGDGLTMTFQVAYELTGSRLVAQGVDLAIPLFGLGGIAYQNAGITFRYGKNLVEPAKLAGNRAGSKLHWENAVSGVDGDFGYLPTARQLYVREVYDFQKVVKDMHASGASLEDIARFASNARDNIKIKYRAYTPPDLLEIISSRNMMKYGNVVGPTFEDLIGKGKTFEQIIEGATRSGGSDIF